MSEFVVKVFDRNGHTLRRFVVVGTYAVALHRGYEAASETRGAADVAAIRA